MICGACALDAHENCEDVLREAAWYRWYQENFPNMSECTDEQMAEIRANQPSPSCPCQHHIDEERSA